MKVTNVYCPRCVKSIEKITECNCGYEFGDLTEEELDELKDELEDKYEIYHSTSLSLLEEVIEKCAGCEPLFDRIQTFVKRHKYGIGTG